VGSGDRSRTIPTYALYGETRDDPALGLLHCESIAARSNRHDWEIRPHRHDALFQLLYMRNGTGFAELEGRKERLGPGCLLSLPALTVHGFRFSRDVDGYVVTFPDAALTAVLWEMPDFIAFLSLPRLIWLPQDSDARADLDQAVLRLVEEFGRVAPGRAAVLHAHLSTLLVSFGRAMLVRDSWRAGTRSRKMRHLRDFRATVERTFRNTQSIGTYASSLGITATQLNRLCREVVGKSALDIVHDRLILEAKRELIYTTLTVNEIAYDLGFRDPAYFSRFFRKRTGVPPSRFRGLAGLLPG
jgi:AraC family transcriptional activator of pobA